MWYLDRKIGYFKNLDEYSKYFSLNENTEKVNQIYNYPHPSDISLKIGYPIFVSDLLHCYLGQAYGPRIFLLNFWKVWVKKIDNFELKIMHVLVYTI